MCFQTTLWSCPAAFVRVFVKQALTKVWKRRWRGRADWINTMHTVIESGSLVVWGGTSFSSSFCFPAKEETATFLTLPCPWGPAEPPLGCITEGTLGGRAAATSSFTLMGVPHKNGFIGRQRMRMTYSNILSWKRQTLLCYATMLIFSVEPREGWFSRLKAVDSPCSSQRRQL